MTMNLDYALSAAASLALWGVGGLLLKHFVIDRTRPWRNRR